MHFAISIRRNLLRVWLWLFCAEAMAAVFGAEPAAAEASLPLVTNIFQLHRLASAQGRVDCSMRLEAVVCAVVPGQNWIVLGDDTGAEMVETDFEGVAVKPGNRVLVEGERLTVIRTDIGLQIGPMPLVDNDGVHSMETKSGALRLRPGAHRIRLDWFNYNGQFGLKMNCEGPDMLGLGIPSSALSPERNPSGAVGGESGLTYRCYEGDWFFLPDFRPLTAVKTGVAPSFDVGVKSRADGVAIEFSGYLTIAQEGLYRFSLTSDDGSRLFVDETSPQWKQLDSSETPIQPRNIADAGLLNAAAGDASQWASMEGMVLFASEQSGRMAMELESATGRVRVIVVDGAGLPPASLLRHRIRVAGVGQNVRTLEGRWLPGTVLVPSKKEVELLEAPSEVKTPVDAAVLTSAEQVQALKPEEALRGHPVRIRGTITCTAPWATDAIIQDETRGIFVSHLTSFLKCPLLIGEMVEVEGMADPGDFSPTVVAKQAARLGAGRMPAPLHPAWDQLMNGSLDAQYVEIQGVITAVQSNRCSLLTQGGKISVEMQWNIARPLPLSTYEKRLVRVRGCLLAVWTGKSRQFQPGQIRIGDPSISLEDFAAEDPFSVPAKRAAELLVFDSKANALQRVRIDGQIVHLRDGAGSMMDGSNGVRFVLSEPAVLRPGDRVEIAGYPELGGPSPVLREALARKTGSAPLPPAEHLAPEDLWRKGLDSTRVRLEGVLAFIERNDKEITLQMKAGGWDFVARLDEPPNAPLSLSVGSRLALTGVYVDLGAKITAGHKNPAFILMLNSPSDIEVLARPSWWTLYRILTVAGIMSMIPLSAMVWAFTLRRKVRMQTQIIRQKLQHEATLEERTRIAREFHDTLEQALAGIGMQLNALAGASQEMKPEFRRILEMTRLMVRHSQEEARRSVHNLRSFDLEEGDLPAALSELAARAKQGTSVDIRFEVLGEPCALSGRVERHLLRIGQEAAANAVKHAEARHVWMNLEFAEAFLRLSITDDGHGFDTQKATDSEKGHFGLLGMRERAEKAGGKLTIQSAPGRGTTIEVCVPTRNNALETTSLL